MVRVPLAPLVVASLALPGLLGSAAAAAPAGPAAVAAPNWTPGPAIPARGELTAVTEHPGLFDVTVFGVEQTWNRTYAYAWDAAAAPDVVVQRVDVPDVGRIRDADGQWAVGERGVLRQVDGVWRRTPVPASPGKRVTLTRVVVSDETWAIGVESAGTDPAAARGRRAVVLRWDGAAWQQVAVPVQLLGPRAELTAVTAHAQPLVFGIDRRPTGDRAVALRYDGTAWRRIDVPSRPGQVDHLTASSFYAVGGWTAPAGAPPDARRPLLYRIDASDGRLVPTVIDAPRRGEVTDLAHDYGVPVAIGVTGGAPFGLRAVLEDDGFGLWRREAVTPLRGRVVAVAGTTDGNLFAVGHQQVGDTRRPLVLTYSDEAGNPPRRPGIGALTRPSFARF